MQTLSDRMQARAWGVIQPRRTLTRGTADTMTGPHDDSQGHILSVVWYHKMCTLIGVRSATRDVGNRIM